MIWEPVITENGYVILPQNMCNGVACHLMSVVQRHAPLNHRYPN